MTWNILLMFLKLHSHWTTLLVTVTVGCCQSINLFVRSSTFMTLICENCMELSVYEKLFCSPDCWKIQWSCVVVPWLPPISSLSKNQPLLALLIKGTATCFPIVSGYRCYDTVWLVQAVHRVHLSLIRWIETTVCLRISMPSLISPKKLDFRRVRRRTETQTSAKTSIMWQFTTTPGQKAALRRNQRTTLLTINSQVSVFPSVFVCLSHVSDIHEMLSLWLQGKLIFFVEAFCILVISYFNNWNNCHLC